VVLLRIELHSGADKFYVYESNLELASYLPPNYPQSLHNYREMKNSLAHQSDGEIGVMHLASARKTAGNL